jgi:hypothetical protein
VIPCMYMIRATSLAPEAPQMEYVILVNAKMRKISRDRAYLAVAYITCTGTQEKTTSAKTYLTVRADRNGFS